MIEASKKLLTVRRHGLLEGTIGGGIAIDLDA